MRAKRIFFFGLVFMVMYNNCANAMPGGKWAKKTCNDFVEVAIYGSLNAKFVATVECLGRVVGVKLMTSRFDINKKCKAQAQKYNIQRLRLRDTCPAIVRAVGNGVFVLGIDSFVNSATGSCYRLKNKQMQHAKRLGRRMGNFISVGNYVLRPLLYAIYKTSKK